jgi:hypothetical protein
MKLNGGRIIRRLMEVAAVLMLLAGCGAGLEPVGTPDPNVARPPTLANDDTSNVDPCTGLYTLRTAPTSPAAVRLGTSGQSEMRCVDGCDVPGAGGDPRYSVPSSSGLMRSTGAMTYEQHYPGVILNSYNVRLRNASGTIIGHVAMGGTKHWFSLHAVVAGAGDVRLRFGAFQNPDGSLSPWFAANFNRQGWTPLMNAQQAQAYYASLPPSQANLIVLAQQAAVDSQGSGGSQPPWKNPDGSCTIEGWIVLGGISLGACSPSPLAWGCPVALGFLTGYCILPPLFPPPAPPWPAPVPSWDSPEDSGDDAPNTLQGDTGGGSDPGGGVICP